MQLWGRIFRTERVWMCAQVFRCRSILTGWVTCAAVAAPVVRFLFVVQHFPSMWQAASPLYPGFVKESSKCQRVPLTPTGFLNCGSNQHWEVPSMPRRPSQKLSTLLLLLPFFPPFFLKCHLPSCSSPMAFLRLTNTEAPVLHHYCSTAWINSCPSWRGLGLQVDKR